MRLAFIFTKNNIDINRVNLLYLLSDNNSHNYLSLNLNINEMVVKMLNTVLIVRNKANAILTQL